MINLKEQPHHQTLHSLAPIVQNKISKLTPYSYSSIGRTLIDISKDDCNFIFM